MDFPLGIDPPVSSGEVCGLGREFGPPEGQSVLTNLISFDVVVNPGTSDGFSVDASDEMVTFLPVGGVGEAKSPLFLRCTCLWRLPFLAYAAP